MPVKVLVSRGDTASDPTEYLFDQEEIVIGRAHSADLPLSDPDRVVSKEHARITHRANVLQLVDLGSKNLTYLNGAPLQGDRPYPLDRGDVIRIGGFELHVELVEAPPRNDDRTMFEARYVNPFIEQTQQLAAALQGLQEAYDQEAPHRRQDALLEALRATLAPHLLHEAERLAVSYLGGTAAAAPAGISPPSQPVPALGAPASGRSPERTSAAGAAVAPERVGRLLAVLSGAVARLIAAPQTFRHEFMGQTIWQASDAVFLYEGDGAALQARLLDPALDEGESEERLTLLQEALDQLALHQVALLDGYRASARDGAQRLLDVLDPGAAQQAVVQTGRLYRILPVLAKMRVMEYLQQKWQELREEDWSAAERRVYRPVFNKAYLARMSTGRAGEPDDA